MHIYTDTPLEEMKTGDLVLLDDYKTPFRVEKVRDDHLIVKNNRSGTFCVYSKKYRRIVRKMSEWLRV